MKTIKFKHKIAASFLLLSTHLVTPAVSMDALIGEQATKTPLFSVKKTVQDTINSLWESGKSVTESTTLIGKGLVSGDLEPLSQVIVVQTLSRMLNQESLLQVLTNNEKTEELEKKLTEKMTSFLIEKLTGKKGGNLFSHGLKALGVDKVAGLGSIVSFMELPVINSFFEKKASDLLSQELSRFIGSSPESKTPLIDFLSHHLSKATGTAIDYAPYAIKGVASATKVMIDHAPGVAKGVASATILGGQHAFSLVEYVYKGIDTMTSKVGGWMTNPYSFLSANENSSELWKYCQPMISHYFREAMTSLFIQTKDEFLKNQKGQLHKLTSVPFFAYGKSLLEGNFVTGGIGIGGAYLLNHAIGSIETQLSKGLDQTIKRKAEQLFPVTQDEHIRYQLNPNPSPLEESLNPEYAQRNKKSLFNAILGKKGEAEKSESEKSKAFRRYLWLNEFKRDKTAEDQKTLQGINQYPTFQRSQENLILNSGEYGINLLVQEMVENEKLKDNFSNLMLEKETPNLLKDMVKSLLDKQKIALYRILRDPHSTIQPINEIGDYYIYTDDMEHVGLKGHLKLLISHLLTQESTSSDDLTEKHKSSVKNIILASKTLSGIWLGFYQKIDLSDQKITEHVLSLPIDSQNAFGPLDDNDLSSYLSGFKRSGLGNNGDINTFISYCIDQELVKSYNLSQDDLERFKAINDVYAFRDLSVEEKVRILKDRTHNDYLDQLKGNTLQSLEKEFNQKAFQEVEKNFQDFMLIEYKIGSESEQRISFLSWLFVDEFKKQRGLEFLDQFIENNQSQGDHNKIYKELKENHHYNTFLTALLRLEQIGKDRGNHSLKTPRADFGVIIRDYVKNKCESLSPIEAPKESKVSYLFRGLFSSKRSTPASADSQSLKPEVKTGEITLTDPSSEFKQILLPEGHQVSEWQNFMVQELNDQMKKEAKTIFQMDQEDFKAVRDKIRKEQEEYFSSQYPQYLKSRKEFLVLQNKNTESILNPSNIVDILEAIKNKKI